MPFESVRVSANPYNVPVAVPDGKLAVTRTDPAAHDIGCDCDTVRGVAVNVGGFCVPVNHVRTGVPTVTGPCAPLMNATFRQADPEDPAAVRT